MEIDCRGKACPQPVVMVKQALEQLGEGEVDRYYGRSNRP